ncbi:PAS domain S-box-containing protein [Rheinheimera pacifica]|uniref:PAS domain-containing protein n=1 Tax=Rheinheimera pacifica TaxID=173990 RepID=UPI002168790C|nr:PAS domain-containing protein [Rheinheimera pacifica]MCS4306078.1 PAS domain S-box-containing protein [Rheinheimera pacifica]
MGVGITDDINLLPCPLLITDLLGRMLQVNSAFKEEFGDCELGTNIDSILPKASQIFLQTHIWPLLHRQGSVKEIYLKVRARTEPQLPVLLNCSRGEFLQQQCYRWVMFPARERSRFERELLKTQNETMLYARRLQKANARLQAVLNSVTEFAIMVLSPDGTVCFNNAGAENLLRYQAGGLAGRNIMTLFKQTDTASTALHRLQAVFTAKGKTGFGNEAESLQLDASMTDPDGNEIRVAVSVSPVSRKTSTVDELLLVATDRRQRKQLQCS